MHAPEDQLKTFWVRLSVNNPMSKSISPEVRQQIDELYLAGESVNTIAAKLGVSRRAIYYHLSQQEIIPHRKPRGDRRGPKSGLDAWRHRIESLQAAQPHLSIREVCKLLELPYSVSHVCRMLKHWKTLPADSTDTMTQITDPTES